MGRWFWKRLPFCLMGAVGAAAVLIGAVYFTFISRRIYEDSTGHLQEIYGQVNRSLGAFVDRNWGLLDSWGDFFALTGEPADGEIEDFITEKQKYWGFSEFYFLTEDGACVALDGTEERMEPEESWEELLRQRQPVMAGGILSDGQPATVFAVPVRHGEYRGRGFDAIAISYTNADMAASLDVDAFSGEAKCFVIHNDGRVLFSTQTGGNIFQNYFLYLQGASDLGEERLARIRDDWMNGISGLVSCRIGGVSHCVLYQPVGYQDYFLLSVVPQSAVSAGFLSVQKTTMAVLIVLFLLIGALVVSPILLRSRRLSHRSRTELQYRESMFDVLSNSVDDIFIMLDTEREKVDYISPNIERLLGIPAREAREDIRVMEKCAVDYNVVIPREELEAIPLHGSRYWECEYMHQNTGERRWYRMTVYHMSIQDIRKYIIVLSDRTQERQMNRQLTEALEAARSANEAKSNFLSNMSHDIRTPMNAIIGFTALLEKDADREEKVREYTGKIMASSRHLLGLVNDVLDMSKIESGKTSLNVERFRLAELLEELDILMAPQARAKGQSFHIQVQGDPPAQLLGDKLRLNQILLNLLSNAVKYTPDGGAIEFLVCGLPQDAPQSQYVKLRFVVRDNGIGMSEEFQEHIFAPFSREISSATNRVQGTGLGMAITKNLVDLMGGIIRVESCPGQGSTFTVELSFGLPRQEEAEPEACREEEAGGETDGVLEGRLFLAAEDNELNAEILTEMLGMEGARCELAQNGQEALAMFEASRPGYYDMILMDVQMPVMNGYEAARRIRASGHPEAATIPIVAMTANTFAEDVRDALESGMNGHLAKPIDMKAVRRTVGKLLREKGRENPGKG